MNYRGLLYWTTVVYIGAHYDRIKEGLFSSLKYRIEKVGKQNSQGEYAFYECRNKCIASRLKRQTRKTKGVNTKCNGLNKKQKKK